MLKYDITERWNIDKSEFIQLLPIGKITEILGAKPDIKIACDDEILDIDVKSYNMPIFTRAFNQDLHKHGLQRENLYKYHNRMGDRNLKDIFSIKLPQTWVYGNMVNDEYMIGIHIAKIRKDEIFINDIILKKSPDQLMKNNISNIVIERLITLGKSNGIKFISGYAVNEKVFTIFIDKGFQADKRKCYGNDWLFEMAIKKGSQYPFFLEID